MPVSGPGSKIPGVKDGETPVPTSFKKVRAGDRVVLLLKGSHGGRYTGKCQSQGSGKMALSGTMYYTEDPKTGNLKRNISRGDLDFVTEDVIGCWVIAEAKTSIPGQRIAARAAQSRKRKVDQESEDEDEDEEEEDEEDEDEEERESVMEIPEEEAKEEEKERKKKKPAREKHTTKRRPFLMLTSTSALVQDGNVRLDPGDVNTVVHKEHRYALSVYNNPKVGRKPAKVVPLLTNCLTGGSLPHRSGRYHLPGIIANYRRFAPGVDTFNQMCLQHREEHRFQSWWKALGGMVLRIAATKAFTSCQALRLSPGGETMFDWQLRLMRYIFPAGQIEVVDKHVPIVVGKRGSCVHCGMGTTRYKCKACGCYPHVECFADHHE